MVLLLVGGVGGVFLFFTLIAVCYRYSHTHPPVSFAMYFRWWEITPSLRTVDGLVGAFAWLWQLATPPTPLPLPSLSDPWQQSFQLQANAANCSTLRWCSFPDILVFHIYIYRMPVKNESIFSLFWSHWGWLVLRIRQGFVWLKLLCWTSVEHLWIASMCRLSPRDTYSCYDVFHLLSAHWVADWCFCLFMYSHT